MRDIRPNWERRPVASAARTVTGNSGELWLPSAPSYTFWLDVNTVTGTSPTLDLTVEMTPDSGTTWFGFMRFAQITAAAERRVKWSPGLGTEAAEEALELATTGGASVDNMAVSATIRILWTIGGTSPSFTFLVDVIGERWR